MVINHLLSGMIFQVWTLRSALLGGNSLPIGHPPQILLRGARALDEIVRNIIPCHPGFEIHLNFAIFENDCYPKTAVQISQAPQG